MNESEHLDELFDLLYKTDNNTCRDRATKLFESFVDQKPQRLISSSTNQIPKFQNVTQKNLFIWCKHNTSPLPSIAAIERVFL